MLVINPKLTKPCLPAGSLSRKEFPYLDGGINGSLNPDARLKSSA